jgi:hypothetical protein
LLFYRVWPKGDWSASVKQFALGYCTSIQGVATETSFDADQRAAVLLRRKTELINHFADLLTREIRTNGYG